MSRGARRLTLTDLGALAVPSDPALSPDGRTVAYVLQTVDTDADDNQQALWLVDVEGAHPRPLTHGRADSAPRWSPDGSRLAFLRGDGGPAQVWLLPMDGPGEPRQLTRLPLGAGTPVWSPDGTRLACVAPADLAAAEDETEEAAERRRRHAPVVVDRLGHKADGAGLVRTLRHQLFVVDVATGDTRQVTDGDQHVGAVAWHPDGSRLAVAATVGENADLTGTVPVCFVDAKQERATVTPAVLRDGLAAALAWLPDGDGLLAVGRTDTATGHLRLLRIPADAGEPVDLAPGLDRNVMPGGPGYPGGLPQLTADGETVVFCARDRGCTNVFAVPAAGGEVRRVLGDNTTVVSGLSVAARTDRIACVAATPSSYGEIVAVDASGGAGRTLTGHTRTALPDVDLFAPQERTFHVADGTDVHGWLLRDPAAALPAPLLLDVHGGPHNAWSPVPDPGHGYQQVLAARGWAVLTLNPRGSDGYGEAFYTAGVGGWGERDEADFLAAVDALVEEGIADPARMAVHGYSYGGFMTCWLTGHTDRFAAAVAGGVVVDQTSMLASDLGYYLAHNETAALPWQDPERCAAQSPFASVQHVTTPTLILHGAADDRCPPGQAEQWFTALRARGVPTRLVLYPEASHLFILEGRPSHRVDYGQRLIDWLDEHTSGGER